MLTFIELIEIVDKKEPVLSKHPERKLFHRMKPNGASSLFRTANYR